MDNMWKVYGLIAYHFYHSQAPRSDLWLLYVIIKNVVINIKPRKSTVSEAICTHHGIVQDGGFCSVLEMEIPQSWANPLISCNT